MIKPNPFERLAEMFPDDRFDAVGRLFHSADDYEVGDDAWRLNGLAVLLTCLDDADEDDLTDSDGLAVPLLAKMMAIRAAYRLGAESARRLAHHAPATPAQKRGKG